MASEVSQDVIETEMCIGSGTVYSFGEILKITTLIKFDRYQDSD